MSDEIGNVASEPGAQGTGAGANQAELAESEAGADAELNELDTLRAELEVVREEAKYNYERYLRCMADLDNVRKRAIRDVGNAHKFGVEKFAREMLNVRDGLVKGLEAAGDDPVVQAFCEGSRMSLKKFDQTLQQFGVTELEPLGQAFDPEFHEALAMLESPGAAPNSVIEVVQSGYQINGRLLRPARVVVARGSD